MTKRLLLAAVLMLTLAVPMRALAHEAARDANGGHECTQADASAGKCEPAGSYHCHVQACVQPSDKPPTTSGGPTLADLQGQTGATPTAAVSTPIASAAPSIVAATPVPTSRALATTGTFTDVLGWIAIAVLFFGFALILFTGRERSSTPPGPT